MADIVEIVQNNNSIEISRTNNIIEFSNLRGIAGADGVDGTDANVSGEINYLSGAIDTNTTNIELNDADITYLSGQIDSNTSLIELNDADIDYLSGQIDAIDTSLGDSAYSTVNANSGTWGTGGDSTLGDSAYSTVQSNSGNWDSTYSTVQSNSATWGTGGTDYSADIAYVSGAIDDNTSAIELNDADITYLSGQIDAIDSTLGDSAYSTVQSNSANWDSTYSTVQSNSASWALGTDYSGDISYLSGIIDNNTSAIELNDADITYLSGQIDAIDTTKYDNTYTTVNSNSADWSNHSDYTNEINYLSGAIDTNTSNISSNDLDINYLSGQIDNNSANINWLSGQLDVNNDANIVYLSGVIDYVSGVVDTNISNITNVTTTVETNSANWSAHTESLPASSVFLDTLGTPLYSTVYDWSNNTQSAGIITGGDISDSLSGTINISTVYGIVKSSNSAIGANLYFELSGTTGLALTDETTNYISVDYNGGTPQFNVSTSNTANGHTIFNLGKVFKEGTSLDIIDSGLHIQDLAKRIQQKEVEINTLQFVSGARVSETGTRNIAITAGILYTGLNRQVTNAIDTSGTDNFEYYYYTGAAWTESDQTQINNLQYNNVATGLATLDKNQYGIHWVYKGTNSTTYVIYGQDSYKLNEAQDAQPPASLPNHVEGFGVLRAKIIIEKNGTTFTEIESIDDINFNTSTANNHNELGNIQGGTADQYYHLTAAEYSDLGSQSNIDYLSGVIDINTTSITNNNLDIAYLSGSIDAINIEAYDSAYSTVNSNSADWSTHSDYTNEINYLSGAIDGNTSNIELNDADITFLSGSIDAIDTSLGDSAYSTVNANSGTWGTGGTDYSADINYLSGEINALSGEFHNYIDGYVRKTTTANVGPPPTTWGNVGNAFTGTCTSTGLYHINSQFNFQFDSDTANINYYFRYYNATTSGVVGAEVANMFFRGNEPSFVALQSFETYGEISSGDVINLQWYQDSTDPFGGPLIYNFAGSRNSFVMHKINGEV